MSKKKFSLVRACAVVWAAGLILAACSSGGSSATQKGPHQKISLTWWTWTANPKSVIANFEKKYPWITIKPPPSYGSGGTFYAKLTTALAAGNGPDVTQVELDHLPSSAQAHDLVNIAQSTAIQAEYFPSLGVEPVTQGSNLYAMPKRTRPDGPDVPPGVLKKYHLPVPTTWATYASDAVALHKSNPVPVPRASSRSTTGTTWRRCSGAGRRPSLPTAAQRHLEDRRGPPAEQKVLNYWGKLMMRRRSRWTTTSPPTGATTSPATCMRPMWAPPGGPPTRWTPT